MSTWGYRWHLGFLHWGKPDDLATGLAHYVRRNRLSDLVLGLHLERKPGAQYYFFLHLETEYPNDLGESEDVLLACPLFKGDKQGPFTFDEIKSMVSGELKLTTLGQTIEYRRLQREALDDPFEAESSTPTVSQLAANQLLWYLSSVGNGSWETFQKACSALGIAEQGAASRMARTLRLLGHIELSPDGRRWSVNPKQQVSNPTAAGEQLVYLIGARRPADKGPCTPQYSGPDRLRAELDAGSSATALSYAEHLPALDRFIENLSEYGSVNVDHSKFSIYGLTGFTKTNRVDRPGFYEIAIPTGNVVNLLRDSSGKWRSGDWYSLRFAQLQLNNLTTEFEYDRRSWRLAIMADQRPPLPYERALVLASGLLPENRDGWLIYQNVSPELASSVAIQLGVDFSEGDL